MGLAIAPTTSSLPPELQNVAPDVLRAIYSREEYPYGNSRPWLQDPKLENLLSKFISQYQEYILVSIIPLCLVTHRKLCFDEKEESTEKNLPLMLYLFGKRLSNHNSLFMRYESTEPLEATVIGTVAMRATRATSQDPYSNMKFCHQAPLPVYGNSTYTNLSPEGIIRHTRLLLERL